MATKVCPKCKKRKSASEFYRNNKRKKNFSAYCKKCTNKRYKIYYEENKLGILKKNEEHRLTSVYNLTPKQSEDISKSQNYRCALCGKHKSECWRGLFIDHDHKTGRIRGKLCNGCNIKLGWYENRKELIKEYLKGK